MQLDNKEEVQELPVEVRVEEYDIDAEESEEEDLERTRVSYDVQLINASKKGDLEQVEKCLNKKANINFEDGKMKWSPLVWASCKGHLSVAKLLILKGAAQQYVNVEPLNRQVIMGTIREVRTTPLQWACFKGHVQIFLLLLKAGLHWEDVDQFGNNSVNLSAAGNHVDIFRFMMQYGVLTKVKNSRGHSVLQLTTNKDILKLANNCQKAVVCHSSKEPFGEQEIKHWCWICDNFFKGQNFRVEWVLRDAKQQENNMIDGRCRECWHSVEQHTLQLQKSIDNYQQGALTAVLEAKRSANVKFEVKFLEMALGVEQKLIKQNQVMRYLDTLAKVPNYKIILKAVDKIECMLKESQDKNIEFDLKSMQTINRQKERLIAERNLRYLTDSIDISTTTRENVAELEAIYSKADEKKVAAEYLQAAGELKTKMAKSILAQDLCQMFIEYPERPDPYPDPLIIDPKSKRPLDPVNKKPTDPMTLLPKKKKGKKEPKFLIPEWATEIKDMNDKIKELQQLLRMQDQLGLSEDFVKKCASAVALMKRESRYRKDMGQLQKMVDEALAKQKKAA